MEQTAVEWLVDYLKNIKELPFIRQNLNMNEQNILDDIIEQAKEMEKNNLYECGSFWRGKENKIEKPFFEQWYNETFKSDEKI